MADLTTYPTTAEMTLQAGCVTAINGSLIGYPHTAEMTLQAGCAQGVLFYDIMKLFTQPIDMPVI